MLEGNGRAEGPSWVRELRQAAISYFAQTSFPTPREEDWKYTNVASIEKIPFRAVLEPALDGLTAAKMGDLTVDNPTWPRLVFVDGWYAEGLSSVPRGLDGREGLVVASLGQALATGPGSVVEGHLGRYVPHNTNAFTALNTAFVYDGAFVYLPTGWVAQEPIHLVFVSTGGERPLASYPRVLVVAGRGSAATIIESYVSASEGRYLTNAVAEIVLGEGASVDHCRIMRESRRAFHVARSHVYQGRDSVFSSFSLAMGGELARNDLNVLLDGEGAECTLNGLYVATDSQHVDNHTAIDHRRPHGTSRQLYKGILGGTARAVFNGKIMVRPGAQKTDAQQTNKNLLLSDHATVDTKPQLEIFADDVKCTHGAAIGQLDPEMVFYLKSRALGQEAARALLTYGFAREVMGRIKVEAVAAHLGDLLAKTLALGASPLEPS